MNYIFVPADYKGTSYMIRGHPTGISFQIPGLVSLAQAGYTITVLTSERVNLSTLLCQFSGKGCGIIPLYDLPGIRLE